MKILFITIGKQNDSSVSKAIIDYTKRINNYFKTEWKVIPSSDIKKEGLNILKTISSDDYLIVLDERGKELSTIELADFIEKRMIASDKRIVFVIGGAYGVDEQVLQKANFEWSLSKLIFPHQIVRLILSETIYRAITVIKNEPYHHF